MRKAMPALKYCRGEPFKEEHWSALLQVRFYCLFAGRDVAQQQPSEVDGMNLTSCISLKERSCGANSISARSCRAIYVSSRCVRQHH